MRLVLLGIIFLLLLTLGNAWMLHQGTQLAVAHDNAALQLGQNSAVRNLWDAFVWRQIAAVVATALVFGAIASTARRAPRSKSDSNFRPR